MSVFVVLVESGAIHSIHKTHAKALDTIYRLKCLYENATMQKFDIT